MYLIYFSMKTKIVQNLDFLGNSYKNRLKNQTFQNDGGIANHKYQKVQINLSLQSAFGVIKYLSFAAFFHTNKYIFLLQLSEVGLFHHELFDLALCLYWPNYFHDTS